MPIPVYLDHNATTPVAAEVADAMCEALKNVYGNPSSGYSHGQRAAIAISDARQALANLIGGDPNELIFTGCATEANNLALLGVARATADKRHLVISAVEHPAVMAPARYLESKGWRLTIVPVDQYGRVSAEAVVAAVSPETVLISIMLANNEVGTLQPVAEISRLLKGQNVLLHTDAAQAIGKIPVNVEDLGVDLLTVAGHKFQASKGIGALYVRKGTPIRNVLFGAGHERGFRPGTENVPAIVGLGVAAQLASQRLATRDDRLGCYRDQLHERLRSSIPGLALNGHPVHRLPNTLNISFTDVTGKALLAAACDTVLASVASACHSDEEGLSGVLGAMGINTLRANGAVRLSTGWETSGEDIEIAAQGLIKAWSQLTST